MLSIPNCYSFPAMPLNVDWPTKMLLAWGEALPYKPCLSGAIKRLCNVPRVLDAVLDLSDLALLSFPAITQVPMMLTDQMRKLKAHWEIPVNKPGKPAPWSRLPGVKVVYPHLMTGLNPKYIQTQGLNNNEVWVVQRFLQRLYVKVVLGEQEKLDPRIMDAFFTDEAIYDWENANLADLSSNELLFPGHFFEQATPLQVAQALNETIRDDVYERGFKSYNKTRFDERTNEVKCYQKRRLLAELLLTSEASSGNEDSSGRKEILPTFAQLLNTHAHNCHELVLVAGSILKHLGLKVFQGNIKGLDHVVLLYGLHPKLNSLGEDEVEIEWVPETIHDLFVCDPWAKVACNAEQYVANFKTKMQKWEIHGKGILVTQHGPKGNQVEDEWVNPNSEERQELLDTFFCISVTRF